MPSSDPLAYDLIGIGFGPANLALACALAENLKKGPTAHPIQRVLFIEKHKSFKWHPGMLLPGTRMQISFMKDLATLRNPQSPYTFISYLHDQGRLVSFINRSSHVPSRKEFADYLTWTAEKVRADGISVNYAQDVFAVQQRDDGTVEIKSRDINAQTETSQVARNLIISPGGSAQIPSVLSSIAQDPLVIHSSTFTSAIDPALKQLASLNRALRICVVGSGQSAAETTMQLRDRLTSLDAGDSHHEIDVMIRKGSLKPSDDSPFSNQIFDPSATDTWFSTKSQVARDARRNEYHGTNYGVVNPVTLDALYEIIYDQEVDEGIARRSGDTLHHPQIKLRTNTLVISAHREDERSSFVLITQDSLDRSMVERSYDMVLCATGYHRTAWVDLFKHSGFGKRYGIYDGSTVKLVQETLGISNSAALTGGGTMSPEGNGSVSRSSSSDVTPATSPEDSEHFDEYGTCKVEISRRYRLIPKQQESQSQWPRVYVQGVEEKTHGLSDTLLSVVSVRAGEVLEDMLAA